MEAADVEQELIAVADDIGVQVRDVGPQHGGRYAGRGHPGARSRHRAADQVDTGRPPPAPAELDQVRPGAAAEIECSAGASEVVLDAGDQCIKCGRALALASSLPGRDAQRVRDGVTPAMTCSSFGEFGDRQRRNTPRVGASAELCSWVCRSSGYIKPWS